MIFLKQSWTIIIFGYNEEKTITSVTEKAQSFLIENKINEGEILVIDDGSTDNTESIINHLKEKINFLRIIRHRTNQGIGPALISGYFNARYENLAAVPADGQFDINELKPFINIPDKSFVSFYREQIPQYSAYRNFLTFTNKFFNRYFLGLNIKDVNWVKAYKTKDLKALDLKLRSSLVGSEICAKLIAKGWNAIESPSIYYQRTGGKPRGGSSKVLVLAISELLKLLFIIRKFKNK